MRRALAVQVLSRKKVLSVTEDRQLVFEANSVEEALDAASRQWGVPAEELRAEVIGSEKGFLGLFGRKLKVEVRVARQPLIVRGRDFVNDLLALMDLRASAAVCDEENLVDIKGQDAEILVGRHGDGLKSMEYLLNLALRDPGAEPRVRLDSNGYRERRMRSLERLAEATARQVVEYGSPIRLDPMLSWERWVIHTTLKDRDDVKTESVGEAPERKVVVLPKIDASRLQEGGYRPAASRFPRRRRR